METLLVHEDAVANGVGSKCLMALRSAGVKCLGGPRAMKVGLCDHAAMGMKCEYGNLTCMIEVVANLDEAVDWIHASRQEENWLAFCCPWRILPKSMRQQGLGAASRPYEPLLWADPVRISSSSSSLLSWGIKADHISFNSSSESVEMESSIGAAAV